MDPHNFSRFQVIWDLVEKKRIQIPIILFFFFLGLILRLTSVFLTEGNPVEAEEYINYAKAILSLDLSQVTSAWEPGFSFLLAFVFLFFPSDYLTSRITTALVGSFCIPMTFITANSLRNRLANEGTDVNILLSYISSLLVSINPYLILADGRGLREPLMALIFLILLYFIFDYQIRPTKKNFVIISILSIITFSIMLEQFLIVVIFLFLIAFYDFSHYGISNFNWKRYFILGVIIEEAT